MQYALLAIYDSEIEMSLQQDEDDDLLISPSTYTVTSPRRSPRKIQNSDRSSSTTSMTPLMSRTLLYGDGGTTNDDDVEDEEVHRATQQSAAAASAKAPVSGSKVFCDADNCPGLGHNPAAVCSLCEVDLHMECFLQLVRKLKEYPEGCHDQVFCSDVCCVWHGNSGIDVEAVRKERKELQNLLKKQLVELARIAEVRVTQRLNEKSLQVSKAMMVRHLMANKFNDLAGMRNLNYADASMDISLDVINRVINFKVNISATAGNTITLNPDGLYSAGGGGGSVDTLSPLLLMGG